MFLGSMVALVTPMTADQQVDYKALEKLVDYHLDNGTDALVVVGTTGEAAVLSHDEKAKIIQVVLEQVHAKIPVIAGTAAQGTEQTISNTKHAQSLGVDGALVMTPAYIKPPQRCLISHYQAIASSCDLPLILYNVPGRTACDLLPETIATLAKIENIVGIKEASGSVSRTQTIIEYCGDAIDVFSGEDGLTLAIMKLGAKGVISVTANVVPKLMHQLCQMASQERWQDAEILDHKLQILHEALFVEANPIPCKWALSQMQLCSEVLREPLSALDRKYHSTLMNALNTLDVVN